jgi:phage terminase large subunit-like protein
MWVQSKTAFFNMEDWNKCADPDLTLEQFQGEECTLGMDLARKIDLNSMPRVFNRMIDGKRHYYSVSPCFWVPEDTVFDEENKRQAKRYQNWVNTGHLIPTDGAEIDYREIVAEALSTQDIAPVLCSALDPHGATNLSHHLADENLNPVTITQNFTNMSDPMKELEAAISAGRFHHDGNPIMTWCMSNVVGKHIAGNDDIVRPVKEGNDNKIDGAVALMMAIGRIMLSDQSSDFNPLSAMADDDIMVL